jgi:alpha-L-arabinofuranosidase
MKRLFVLVSMFFLPGVLCHAQEAHVRVDLNATGRKVSPNQFGVFLEGINHAGDGGLYNELIRNGSFTEKARGSVGAGLDLTGCGYPGFPQTIFMA